MSFEKYGLTPKEDKLTPEQIAKVKGLGFLRDKRYGDVFNVRMITGNGKITTETARHIMDAADKFGSGEVSFTTRLTVEIQSIKYDDIPAFLDYCAEFKLLPGGTGPRVRPVVSCKGTTCVFGLIDTYGLSAKIHERFYLGMHGVTLPHKFKIAVGGCPHNCVKPNLNDLGVVGGRIAVESAEGKQFIPGYRIFIGGRWGKKGVAGRELSRMLTSEEEVLDLIERAILLFKDEGVKGERFSDTVERLGFDCVEKKLLGD